MNTTEIIASLALVVSLVNFWLYYRTARQNNSVICAEKRTEAHSIFLETLLEIQNLTKEIRNSSVFKEDDLTFKQAESLFVDFSTRIKEELKWLRERHSDDAGLLEGHKNYATELNFRIKDMAPQIRGITSRKTATNMQRNKAYSAFDETSLKLKAFHSLIQSTAPYKENDLRFVEIDKELTMMETTINEYFEWARARKSLDSDSINKSKALAEEFNSKLSNAHTEFLNIIKNV